MMKQRQRGGRINPTSYFGMEHGPEKIIKGHVVDAKTTRKLLEIKERDMNDRFVKFPGRMAGWALDLPRAVNKRPWWARMLLWLALGEAGRHEFWGLVWAITRCGYEPWYPECEWRTHTINKMPLFWAGKEPVELDA